MPHQMLSSVRQGGWDGKRLCNAEHAIKAFARLRRAIEGLSTPTGIEEYLILLSVCQTCKYSGLDFLDFLRSGETDIVTFTVRQWNRRVHTVERKSNLGGGELNS